jgi:hypothetical protein
MHLGITDPRFQLPRKPRGVERKILEKAAEGHARSVLDSCCESQMWRPVAVSVGAAHQDRITVSITCNGGFASRHFSIGKWRSVPHLESCISRENPISLFAASCFHGMVMIPGKSWLDACSRHQCEHPSGPRVLTNKLSKIIFHLRSDSCYP